MVYCTRRFVVCLSVCHFVLVFFSPFSIAITSLGEERANLSAFRTFVRFVLVWICLFSLPLGVWEGLRFVIVALPGLFSYLFFFFFFFLDKKLKSFRSEIQDGRDGAILEIYFAIFPELNSRLTRNLVWSTVVTCRSKIDKTVSIAIQDGHNGRLLEIFFLFFFFFFALLLLNLKTNLL